MRRHIPFLLLFMGAAVTSAQIRPKITTPKEALGFNLGDDYKVANYTHLTNYWMKLASESDRMKIEDIGPHRRGAAPIHDNHIQSLAAQSASTRILSTAPKRR